MTPTYDPNLRRRDISKDGSRVLVNRAVDQAVVEPVTLVQNWTEGLGK